MLDDDFSSLTDQGNCAEYLRLESNNRAIFNLVLVLIWNLQDR
jgi:hypothetical protein